MYVAVDDTDSMDNMCTTYIISEIMSKSKYDIIGNPELVRLNPNISYKTRGNGALNINLGKGEGKKNIIGKIDNKYIYSYEKLAEEPDENDLMDFIYGIVNDYYVKTDIKTNPGIVISKNRFNENLYYRALEEDISIDFIENYLKDRAIYKKIKTGHGIIGSAASLAWNRRRVTYELLDYKYPHYGYINKNVKMEIAKIPEKYDTTFNNIDIDNNYPAIFPKPKTPVIFGIRGINDNDLINAYNEIKNNYNLNDERYVIYKTNQGTDDHIINDPEFLSDLSSYAITGVISSYPYTIQGGHHFINMEYKNVNLKLSAFEPTKEFRKTIDLLIPGDIVRAYGSYVNNTLKLEKLMVISVSKLFKKEAPVCTVCHVKTKNKGNMDYRCPVCKIRYKNPNIYEVERKIKPGYYEVPVIARRHLSMPVELSSYFGEFNDLYKWNSMYR